MQRLEVLSGTFDILRSGVCRFVRAAALKELRLLFHGGFGFVERSSVVYILANNVHCEPFRR